MFLPKQQAISVLKNPICISSTEKRIQNIRKQILNPYSPKSDYKFQTKDEEMTDPCGQ